MMQDVANRYLREQLEAQNAIWGTTIVMEVRTGEILALVNLGRTPGRRIRRAGELRHRA